MVRPPPTLTAACAGAARHVARSAPLSPPGSEPVRHGLWQPLHQQQHLLDAAKDARRWGRRRVAGASRARLERHQRGRRGGTAQPAHPPTHRLFAYADFRHPLARSTGPECQEEEPRRRRGQPPEVSSRGRAAQLVPPPAVLRAIILALCTASCLLPPLRHPGITAPCAAPRAMPPPQVWRRVGWPPPQRAQRGLPVVLALLRLRRRPAQPRLPRRARHQPQRRPELRQVEHGHGFCGADAAVAGRACALCHGWRRGAAGSRGRPGASRRRRASQRAAAGACVAVDAPGHATQPRQRCRGASRRLGAHRCAPRRRCFLRCSAAAAAARPAAGHGGPCRDRGRTAGAAAAASRAARWLGGGCGAGLNCSKRGAPAAPDGSTGPGGTRPGAAPCTGTALKRVRVGQPGCSPALPAHTNTLLSAALAPPPGRLPLSRCDQHRFVPAHSPPAVRAVFH